MSKFLPHNLYFANNYECLRILLGHWFITLAVEWYNIHLYNCAQKFKTT